MKNTKKAFYGLIAVGMVIFAFTDLQISQAIYNPNSTFGWFFESFGELPLALVGVFSSLGMIVTYHKKTTGIDYFHTIGFGLLTVYHAFVGGMLVKVHINLSTPLTLILSVLMIVLMYLLVKAVPQEKHGELRQVSKIGSILAVAAVLVITLIKMMWGRLRFRSMQEDLNLFTAWYLPQGFTTNNEYMSLPSGHSANATVIIMITLLPTLYPKLKNKAQGFWIVSAIWIACVMLSRVVVGAHFASDVTLGMTITMTMFYMLSKRYLRE